MKKLLLFIAIAGFLGIKNMHALESCETKALKCDQNFTSCKKNQDAKLDDLKSSTACADQQKRCVQGVKDNGIALSNRAELCKKKCPVEGNACRNRCDLPLENFNQEAKLIKCQQDRAKCDTNQQRRVEQEQNKQACEKQNIDCKAKVEACQNKQELENSRVAPVSSMRQSANATFNRARSGY